MYASQKYHSVVHSKTFTDKCIFLQVWSDHITIAIFEYISLPLLFWYVFLWTAKFLVQLPLQGHSTLTGNKALTHHHLSLLTPFRFFPDLSIVVSKQFNYTHCASSDQQPRPECVFNKHQSQYWKRVDKKRFFLSDGGPTNSRINFSSKVSSWPCSWSHKCNVAIAWFFFSLWCSCSIFDNERNQYFCPFLIKRIYP